MMAWKRKRKRLFQSLSMGRSGEYRVCGGRGASKKEGQSSWGVAIDAAVDNSKATQDYSLAILWNDAFWTTGRKRAKNSKLLIQKSVLTGTPLIWLSELIRFIASKRGIHPPNIGSPPAGKSIICAMQFCKDVLLCYDESRAAGITLMSLLRPCISSSSLLLFHHHRSSRGEEWRKYHYMILYLQREGNFSHLMHLIHHRVVDISRQNHPGIGFPW